MESPVKPTPVKEPDTKPVPTRRKEPFNPPKPKVDPTPKGNKKMR